MEYIIADALEAELDQLEEIEHECFSVPWTRQQLLSQMPDESHVFLTARSGGDTLGYVGMAYVLDEGYISNVAVRTCARRQGIGDALISALTARAAALGLSFITLEVRRSNAPAAALYGKHGFVPVGERKNYYEHPREDAVLMTKFMK